MGNSTPEPRAVYPRWRGEHFDVVSLLPTKCGLSPLARGTHGENVGDLSEERFIPASTGNTSDGLMNWADSAVYPR